MNEADFRFAAENIPPSLGVVLDAPLPDSAPGGQFGRVYIGTLTSEGRRVAVKVQTYSEVARHEVMILQRIRAAAEPHPPPMLPNLYAHTEHKLRHPNGIVRVWHYIIMDGASSSDGWRELFDVVVDERRFVVTNQGDLDAELRAAEMFVQMLLAILFMHASDLAHVDIKPDNTMSTPGNPDNLPNLYPWTVCVVDFGLAAVIDPRHPKPANAGTQAYKAPEVCQRNQPLSLAVDIWSLAVSLFVAASGCRPFVTSSTKDDSTGNFRRVVAAQELGESSVSAIFGGYGRQSPFSPRLNRLLDAMLTVDAARRPNIFQVLVLALEWVHSLPAAADPPPPWLRAAEAARDAAVNKDPQAIAAAVHAHAPGAPPDPPAGPGSSAQHAAMPARSVGVADATKDLPLDATEPRLAPEVKMDVDSPNPYVQAVENTPDPPSQPNDEAGAEAVAVMDATMDGTPPEPAAEAASPPTPSESPSAEELHAAYIAAMQEASTVTDPASGALSGASSHTALVSEGSASYQQPEQDGDPMAADGAGFGGEDSPVTYCNCSAPDEGGSEPAGPFAATRSLGAAAAVPTPQYRSSSPMAQLPTMLPPVRQNAHVRL